MTVGVMTTWLLLGSVVLGGRRASRCAPQSGRKPRPRSRNRKRAQPPRIKPDLHPRPPEPVPDGEIVAAIQRGVDFLLKDQNGDGSWGSPHRTKDLNILAGNRVASRLSHRRDGDLCQRLDRGERQQTEQALRPGLGSAGHRAGRGVLVP